jgi:3-oxoacyl-[acyl-carrier protein] reductase
LAADGARVVIDYKSNAEAAKQLVRAFARETAFRGITVNSVLPGPVNTDAVQYKLDMLTEAIGQTPLGRLGEPEDIADVVDFLASDDARWITGRRISVDGHLTA